MNKENQETYEEIRRGGREMNKQKQDIAEIKQAINGLANMYGDLVFGLEKANNSKLPNGAIVLLVGKDNQALDEKTIEYFVKHNEQVRKETAKKILLDLKYNLETSQPQDVLNGKRCASNDYHNIIGWIDEIAQEYGVNVEELKTGEVYEISPQTIAEGDCDGDCKNCKGIKSCYGIVEVEE